MFIQSEEVKVVCMPFSTLSLNVGSCPCMILSSILYSSAIIQIQLCPGSLVLFHSTQSTNTQRTKGIPCTYAFEELIT